MNAIGIMLLFIGIGLLFYIPHFFAVQLFYTNCLKPESATSRKFFLCAISICLCITFFIGYEYKRAIVSINEFEKSYFNQLDRNFMTEKILGMHFIYHTRLCIYDGWRPPRHEPILVIGMWLNGREDPLHVDLEKRLELYKKFFPENQYKFECSCSNESSGTYNADPLWK